ncbi:MAG: hypothetical protein QMC80_01515 [Thermoplasmatales archaeon]|nr:hypothetical protein [Thermoplasmatales archaeon]
MGNPISDLIFGAREGLQQSFKGLLATLGFGILIGLILIGIGFLIGGIWALFLILFGIIVIIGSIRRFIVGSVVKGGAAIKSKIFDKQSLQPPTIKQSAAQIPQQTQQSPQPHQPQTIQVQCMHCGQINTVIPGQKSFICSRCGVKSVKK